MKKNKRIIFDPGQLCAGGRVPREPGGQDGEDRHEDPLPQGRGVLRGNLENQNWRKIFKELSEFLVPMHLLSGFS